MTYRMGPGAHPCLSGQEEEGEPRAEMQSLEEKRPGSQAGLCCSGGSVQASKEESGEQPS